MDMPVNSAKDIGRATSRITGGRVAQRNRTEFYKLLARHGLDPGAFKQSAR